MNRRNQLLPALMLAVSFLRAYGFPAGVVPFDWSGQWGLVHRYGFSGWGVERVVSPLHFDGNFAHWPARYRFPFLSSIDSDENELGLNTSLWYRTGDYSLDELSLDILSKSPERRFTRFRALKKNFEDYHGLLDPLARPGGTVQQNYRFDHVTGNSKGGRWQIASAFYLTTDAIPYGSYGIWEKGAERSEKIISNGLSYSGNRGNVKYKVEGSSFLQRYRITRLLEDVTQWSADLMSNRLHAIGEMPVRKGFSLFLSGTGRGSVVSSDTLGNQSLSFIGVSGGVHMRASDLESRAGMGVSAVFPGEMAPNFQGHFRLKRGKSELFLDLKHNLQPLPFQFTGRPFLFVPDSFTPTMVPTVRPDSSATMPTRTVMRIGAEMRWDRASGEVTLFASQATPHHYFESTTEIAGIKMIRLNRDQISKVTGAMWGSRINYFRDWVLSLRGISLLGSESGWGNLFDHQGEMALHFREHLFQKRMDARINLSFNYWSGRTSFIWDPILNLGYSNATTTPSRNTAGIITAEFKAVISSVEISYVLTNVQYIMESASGGSSGTTFSASPLFPPAGRLAYFSVRLNLND